MSVNEIARGYEAYDGVKPLPADATPDFIKGWERAIRDASLVNYIKERLAEVSKTTDQPHAAQDEIDRARRALHQEEGYELLEMLYHLINSAEYLSPDETGVTDMSWQGEGDTEILLRFKGKAFAVGVERF